MNVEVEVIRCVRTTYLVQGAKSLEHAERVALDAAGKKLAGASGVQKTGIQKPETHVAWSEPVQVRDGKVTRDSSRDKTDT